MSVTVTFRTTSGCEGEVILTEDEALALAQFLKRLGFANAAECAVSTDEAYTIISATERLRRAMAEVGYAPR
jgi:hypothetical protein